MKFFIIDFKTPKYFFPIKMRQNKQIGEKNVDFPSIVYFLFFFQTTEMVF